MSGIIAGSLAGIFSTGFFMPTISHFKTTDFVHDTKICYSANKYVGFQADRRHSCHNHSFLQC